MGPLKALVTLVQPQVESILSDNVTTISWGIEIQNNLCRSNLGNGCWRDRRWLVIFWGYVRIETSDVRSTVHAIGGVGIKLWSKVNNLKIRCKFDVCISWYARDSSKTTCDLVSWPSSPPHWLSRKRNQGHVKLPSPFYFINRRCLYRPGGLMDRCLFPAVDSHGLLQPLCSIPALWVLFVRL